MVFIPPSSHYFIPHNYKDAGRIFGLFRMRHLTAALLWSLPITFLLLIFPFDFLSFKAQLYLWACLVGFPAGVMLMGWGDLLALVIRFRRNKRVYYSNEYKK